MMARDVPAELRLVEEFMNSIDAETGADDLGTLNLFRRWLADHDLDDAAASADEGSLELARRVRSELRAEADDHHSETARRRADQLDDLFRQVPLAAHFGAGGEVTISPVGSGVVGVLGDILAAVVLAGPAGSWQRMKICPADDCRVAFYDRSKNGSRRWCSMQVCGNRQKTRTYRGRSQATKIDPA